MKEPDMTAPFFKSCTKCGARIYVRLMTARDALITVVTSMQCTVNPLESHGAILGASLSICMARCNFIRYVGANKKKSGVTQILLFHINIGITPVKIFLAPTIRLNIRFNLV